LTFRIAVQTSTTQPHFKHKKPKWISLCHNRLILACFGSLLLWFLLFQFPGNPIEKTSRNQKHFRGTR